MPGNVEIARQALAQLGSRDYEGSLWDPGVEVVNAEGWIIEVTYHGHDGRWASILTIADGKVVRAEGHLSERRALRAAGLER